MFFPSVHLKCHQPVQQPTVVTGQCYCHYLLLLGMSGGYVLSQVKLYVSSGFSLCACNGSLELCSISAYTACLSIKSSHGGRDRRGSTLVRDLPYCPLPREQGPLVQAGSGRRWLGERELPARWGGEGTVSSEFWKRYVLRGFNLTTSLLWLPSAKGSLAVRGWAEGLALTILNWIRNLSPLISLLPLGEQWEVRFLL